MAVCLLNAYVNPEHETAHRRAISRGRGRRLKVSLSSALNAEIREYERTSTTVLNALLMPVIAGYLDKLTQRMEAEGFAAAAAAGAVERRRVQRRHAPRASRCGFCCRDRQAAAPPARC